MQTDRCVILRVDTSGYDDVVRILAWNIQQGGGTRKLLILDRVKAHDPDVLVFLEFVEKTAGPFLESLRTLGWAHNLSTKPNGRDHHICVLCVLSKVPISPALSGIPTLDDSGLWLEVHLSSHDLTLGVVHVPTTSSKSKRSYFDSLASVARQRKDSPIVFVGDFNTGRHPIDGDLQPLGCVDRFVAIQESGFTDAWRHLNGSQPEFTYYRDGKGYRIDHALASESALSRLAGCWYSHVEREEGVSDHSILLVEFRASPSEARG